MINPFRSFEAVMASPWDRLTALIQRKEEKTDRVLQSTRLDDSIYTDMRQEDEALDAIETAAAEKLKSFPALSRDIFQSFYSLTQRRNPEEKLSPEAREFNTRLLDGVTEQEDYATLKNVCEGRELLAYEAASEFVSRTAGNLDSLLADLGGDKGSMNTLDKLENDEEKAAKKLGELLDQADSSSTPSEPLKKEILSAANALARKERQVEAVSRIVENGILQRKDAFSTALSDAVHSAKERAEEVNAILSSWSDDPADCKRTPMNMELLKRVRQSPALRDVSQYLGRFRELLTQGKKNGYVYGRGETYSLELGNDMGRALTSELSMLAMPQTIPLFLRKYQQKQIKQYRRREPVTRGMGDIICCLDESVSTEGDAAAWGKALAMTLLEIAEEGKRKFALIHFASRSSVKVDVFLPGKYGQEDKLRAAETFLGGGTNFERPLSEALALMEDHGFENADIIFLTDGECALPDDFAENLRQKQTKKNFTVTGILLDVGSPGMEFSLTPFCRKIYRTSQLCGEDVVRSVISEFAV